MTGQKPISKIVKELIQNAATKMFLLNLNGFTTGEVVQSGEPQYATIR